MEEKLKQSESNLGKSHQKNPYFTKKNSIFTLNFNDSLRI